MVKVLTNIKNFNGDLVKIKISDVVNASGVTLDTVLTDYYLKTETYSKEEVNDLVSVKIAMKVVDSLPATGEANIIYFVPRAGSTNPDVYDEYLWVTDTNKFELIGNTQVDLSNYVQFTDYATTAEGGVLLSDETTDGGVKVSTLGKATVNGWGDVVKVTRLATTTQVGLVKSSTANGAISVDNNGVMTCNGFASAIFADVEEI